MGFFTGQLEDHHDMASERARTARGKLPKSHHHFLDTQLAQRAILFNAGRVYTKVWISRRKNHWGPPQSLATKTGKGRSPIIGEQIYCTVLIEMNTIQ